MIFIVMANSHARDALRRRVHLGENRREREEVKMREEKFSKKCALKKKKHKNAVASGRSAFHIAKIEKQYFFQ